MECLAGLNLNLRGSVKIPWHRFTRATSAPMQEKRVIFSKCPYPFLFVSPHGRFFARVTGLGGAKNDC